MAASDLSDKIKSLEDKIASLECGMQELASFNRTVGESLKNIFEGLGRLEQKFNNHLTAQALARVSKIHLKTRTAVFVGKNYFGDNIKYAFLAFHAFSRGKNIDCHFLVEDARQNALLTSAGLPCLTSFAKGGNDADIKTLLNAKIAVLTDNFYPQPWCGIIPHALLQGAKFIQLWHGIPLKEIGMETLCSAEVLAASGPFDALVATNASSREDWAQRFSFHEFAPTGYPRNDVFFRDLSPLDLLNVDIESLNRAQAARREKKPVVVYAPTFRDHVGPEVWLKNAGLNIFAEHCHSRGYAFCVNLHPSDQKAIPALTRHYPEIKFIAPSTDAYPIVKQADILVTDYSSLAFDFLLLDRPILFYRPDHEDYVTKSRPLIKGRKHYTCGPIALNMPELIKSTDAAVATLRQPDSDPYRKARLSLRSELFDHVDGNAGQRVCELIMKHLDAPT